MNSKRVYLCRSCQSPLVESQMKYGKMLLCSSCNTVLTGTGLLNNILNPKVVGSLYSTSKPDSSKKCCYCNQIMHAGSFNEAKPPAEASVCKNCFVTAINLKMLENLKINFPSLKVGSQKTIRHHSSSSSSPDLFESDFLAPPFIESYSELIEFAINLFDD